MENVMGGIVKRTECPNCGGQVWDNTERNNERALKGEKLMPDFSCKDKAICKWVQWRPRKAEKPIMRASELPKQEVKATFSCIKCLRHENFIQTIIDECNTHLEG